MQSPTERVEALAAGVGMVEVSVPDKRLRAFSRPAKSGGLTVYIESDGAPWISPSQPPYDPTPVKPVVMHMAVVDQASGVAYVGRPCQYLDARALDDCDPSLWTLGRYGEAAIAASNAAVNELKRRSGASSVNLVGYSGGGTVAALVAARREDVACLVTLASPLDINAWTEERGLTRLRESLNPADFTPALSRIPQTHFVGARDITVPPSTIRRFIGGVPGARVLTMERFTHTCCWEDEWVTLLKQTCLAK